MKHENIILKDFVGRNEFSFENEDEDFIFERTQEKINQTIEKQSKKTKFRNSTVQWDK